MKKKAPSELPTELREAAEHFVAAGKEMLLAAEALLEVGVRLADRFLEEKPATSPAKKVEVT